jgi:predicted DNA-binding transcriptional regulator AlpA
MKTLDQFLRWCEEAPPGTRIDPHAVAEVLEAAAPKRQAAPAEVVAPHGAVTWRERIWTIPPQTRLGTRELSEALGRPRSWIYARTQAAAADPLPHRKLDGSLVFVAEEIRRWLRHREEIIEPISFGSNSE